MNRDEYQAIRRRVYEAKRACRIEAQDDGRSSYGSKSIRTYHVGRDLNAALASDPRHRCDKTIDRNGYFDTWRYGYRVQVRRTNVLRLLERRRAGKAGTNDVRTLRMYLKPIKEVSHV